MPAPVFFRHPRFPSHLPPTLVATAASAAPDLGVPQLGGLGPLLQSPTPSVAGLMSRPIRGCSISQTDHQFGTCAIRSRPRAPLNGSVPPHSKAWRDFPSPGKLHSGSFGPASGCPATSAPRGEWLRCSANHSRSQSFNRSSTIGPQQPTSPRQTFAFSRRPSPPQAYHAPQAGSLLQAVSRPTVLLAISPSSTPSFPEPPCPLALRLPRGVSSSSTRWLSRRGSPCRRPAIAASSGPTAASASPRLGPVAKAGQT
jgi:hypothetical protein